MADLIESMEEQLLTLQGEDGVGRVCRMMGLFPYEGKQYALLLNLGQQGVKGQHKVIDPTSDLVPVFLHGEDPQPGILDDPETLDRLEEEGRLVYVENELSVMVNGELETPFVKVEVETGEYEGKSVWVSRAHLANDEPTSTVMEFYVKGNLESADSHASVPMFTLPPALEVLRATDIPQGAVTLGNGVTVFVLGNPNQEAIQVIVRDGEHKNRGGWVARRHLTNDQVVFKVIEDDEEFERVRGFVTELALQMDQAVDEEGDE